MSYISIVELKYQCTLAKCCKFHVYLLFFCFFFGVVNCKIPYLLVWNKNSALKRCDMVIQFSKILQLSKFLTVLNGQGFMELGKSFSPTNNRINAIYLQLFSNLLHEGRFNSSYLKMTILEVLIPSIINISQLNITLELIYLYFPPSSHLLYVYFCPVGLSLL